MSFHLLTNPLEKILPSFIGQITGIFMCLILINIIKTKLLVIWLIQSQHIYYYTQNSVGVYVQLIKKNGLYLWFGMMYKHCSHLGFFPIKNNEEGKYIQNEIFNNIPHFIKKRLRVDCIQYGFVMYKNNVIVIKR